MTHYTNMKGISLTQAVHLLHDEYDYNDDPTIISATTLMRPIRQIVLARKFCNLDKVEDISTRVNSTAGTDLHRGAEIAWKTPETVQKAFDLFGIGNRAKDVIINPTPDQLTDTSIPVYMEIREVKETGIEDYKVSGKYDLILNHRVHDYKNVSAWSQVYDSSGKKFIEQGSIYKWLNPDKIQDNLIDIEFKFMDWSAKDYSIAKDKGYPAAKVMSKSYPLMSVEETDRWIKQKVREIAKYMKLPDSELPECTKEELWQSDTTYKYYKNPQNKKRATKNFTNKFDAEQRRANDGFIGEIVAVSGEVKACKTCIVRSVCEQAKKYELAGMLSTTS